MNTQKEDYLYHVTPTKNVGVILGSGLQLESGFVTKQAHGAPAVYLWTTKEDAVWSKKALEKLRGEPHAILRVHATKLADWIKECKEVADIKDVEGETWEIVKQFYPARINEENEGYIREMRLYDCGVSADIIEVAE